MGQEIAVYVIVAVAALNLARVWGRSVKGSSGCGKCGGCGSKPKAEAASKQAPQLVQLQMNLKSKK